MSYILGALSIKSSLYGPYKGTNRPSYELYIPSQSKDKFLVLMRPYLNLKKLPRGSNYQD